MSRSASAILRTLLSLAAVSATVGTPAHLLAQAIAAGGPAPSPYLGFSLPNLGGQLNYSLSASQTIITSYNGSQGTVPTTNFSGDLGLVTRSETHPFSLVYTGGYLVSESNQFPSSAFHTLALSQTYKTRKWNFILADSVSYLPQSPVGGLSGIAGIGDLGVAPVQVGVYSGPGILTNYARRVTNIVSGSGERFLTGSTSVQATGSYSIQRFLDTDTAQYSAYNSNQFGASAGVTHRFDARNTLAVNYTYYDFTYTDQPFSFGSNGVNFEYIRRITPRLTLDASLGPQWNSGSTITGGSLNLATALSLSYLGQRSYAQLSYTRGVNSGSGVVQGALSDTVGFGARRALSRNWTAATSIAYTHSQSLASTVFSPFTIQSVVASGQLSRSIGRYFSAYGSYTLEHQSTDGANLSGLTFNGLQQVFGFGVTYSPSSIHLGRR